jgi:hypothetical protein
MSRTYRFKKDKWLISEYSILRKYVGYGRYRNVDAKSKEGRKILAVFRSDKKAGIMRWSGPGWFIHMFVEESHRANSRDTLKKYFRFPDEDLLIEGKPTNDQYWF